MLFQLFANVNWGIWECIMSLSKTFEHCMQAHRQKPHVLYVLGVGKDDIAIFITPSHLV
jgi:hypothetical protein